MKTLLFLFVLFTTTANAACPHLYPQPIKIDKTSELCNSFFVVLYNVKDRRAVLTSERLVHGAAIGDLPRVTKFHVDARVPGSPHPTSYFRTGYDRGHMVPADDASTPKEMFDTFLMTNMTPQKPLLNRLAWKQLEIEIRDMAESSSEDVFVVTIAVYDAIPLKINKIPVPVGYWKVVFVDDQTRIFYANNIDNAVVVEKFDITLPEILNGVK